MSGYDITSVVDMYLSRNPEPTEIHSVIVAALDPEPTSAAAAGTMGWAFAYAGKFIGVPYRETKYPKTLSLHTAIYVILDSLKK